MNLLSFAYRNVSRSKRTYGAFFLSSSFSVMVFFIYSMFIFHPDVKSGTIEALAIKAMEVAQWLIYIFSFFFILYSTSAFLSARKKELGLLSMLGMTNKKLRLLVFMENMFISLFSILTGIGFGLLFAKVFLLVGSKFLGLEPLSFYISWKSLSLTTIAFLALFMVITIFTSLMLKQTKLIELLVGSAKPKKEPKVSVWFSLLAIILFGVGYYLAITTTENNMVHRLLPCVASITIGTYFFFTQMSVFILKKLKKSRSFFWKRTRMLIISDLVFRMKDNARMFFLVTMVATVAISSVGAMASLNVYSKQFETNRPFALTYLYPNEDSIHEKNLETIEQDMKLQGMDYQKVEVHGKEAISGNTKNKVLLVPLSSYNEIATAKGYKTIQLLENETMIVPANLKYMHTIDTTPRDIPLAEVNVTLSLKGMVDQPIFNQYSIYVNQLVVHDEMIETLNNAKSFHYVGYMMDGWLENFEQTSKIGKSIHDQVMNNFEQLQKGEINQPPFIFTSAGYDYKMTKLAYRTMMFIGLLVGAVFFIAAGSFIYFRLYTDLEEDQVRYRAISKIGLTDKELKKIITSQLQCLFFIPIIVAVIHSLFAFTALQSLYTLSIVKESLIVILVFFIAQILYFLLIRQRYFTQVKRKMVL
ncbi:FtsX-like permease family protein [Peribacillus acanthi]|uniref:FtsX-like permease family protein n=1 Tax=Peribacillus acanthi TaxID=2171554 RepID=UPI0013006E22|nr:ABC transporter permease [Peribacillus acanthi]